MAMKPLKPCLAPGCSALSNESKCANHRKRSWATTYQQGTRQERGYGAAWQRLRKLIVADQPYCMIAKVCVERTGHPAESTCVDHIVPKAAGGTDDERNLQGACEPCNTMKAATTDKDLVRRYIAAKRAA